MILSKNLLLTIRKPHMSLHKLTGCFINYYCVRQCNTVKQLCYKFEFMKHFQLLVLSFLFIEVIVGGCGARYQIAFKRTP